MYVDFSCGVQGGFFLRKKPLERIVFDRPPFTNCWNRRAAMEPACRRKNGRTDAHPRKHRGPGIDPRPAMFFLFTA
jgi:hypothetical protein